MRLKMSHNGGACIDAALERLAALFSHLGKRA